MAIIISFSSRTCFTRVGMMLYLTRRLCIEAVTLDPSDHPNNTGRRRCAGPLLSRSFCYLCHPIQEEFLSACTWRCLMGSGKFVLSSVFALALGFAPLGLFAQDAAIPVP